MDSQNKSERNETPSNKSMCVFATVSIFHTSLFCICFPQREIRAKKKTLTKAKKAATAAKKALDEFQEEMNEKRDEIFAEFTDSIGDIRKYEEEKLERVEQRIEERKKLEKQLGLLQNKLEFERGKDANKETEQQRNKLKRSRSDLKKVLFSATLTNSRSIFGI